MLEPCQFDAVAEVICLLPSQNHRLPLILSVPKPTTLSRLSRPELEMPGFSARVLLLRCPMHLEALNKSYIFLTLSQQAMPEKLAQIRFSFDRYPNWLSGVDSLVQVRTCCLQVGLSALFATGAFPNWP